MDFITFDYSACMSLRRGGCQSSTFAAGCCWRTRWKQCHKQYTDAWGWQTSHESRRQRKVDTKATKMDCSFVEVLAADCKEAIQYLLDLRLRSGRQADSDSEELQEEHAVMTSCWPIKYSVLSTVRTLCQKLISAHHVDTKATRIRYKIIDFMKSIFKGRWIRAELEVNGYSFLKNMETTTFRFLDTSSALNPQFLYSRRVCEEYYSPSVSARVDVYWSFSP